MTLNPGQILNNRYRIVKLLGQGGFGAVYKAWDLNLSAPCAVKENFDTSPEASRQFTREASMLANLHHANLPRVTDHFSLAGQGQYLVMDFVEGQDLEEMRCASGGKLPEAQVLSWIEQVLDALDYLHQQKPAVIHRDLKPANIKITPDNRAVLVDFGIAKTYNPQLKTTLGARAVTPGYSPIEQYGQTNAVTDARTDIYALGATLYTLLTGQEPPEAPLRTLSDLLVPPRQLNPAISPAIDAALLHALQVHPDRRFQSVGEFKKVISGQLSVTGSQSAVGGAAAQGSAAAPALSPITPATLIIPQAARRFPWKWAAIGAGVLAGLALLGVVIGPMLRGAGEGRVTQTATARVVEPSKTPTMTPAPTRAPIPTVTPAPTDAPAPTVTPVPTDAPAPTATSPGIGSSQISPVDGMVLSYIPAGTFQMGSESVSNNELPVHTVTLGAFWMDQAEVTNRMYALCLADRACSPPYESGSSTRSSYFGNSSYADYPVINVDWYQAETYCAWAGRELPTEAQWEYAAHGGEYWGPYPWGGGIDSSMANYNRYVGDTSNVFRYAANGYGLYDMAGNVWEWVADWYGPYSSAAADNPTGPISGNTRVMRGGSWDQWYGTMFVTYRGSDGPADSNNSIGFRCALNGAVVLPADASPTPTPVSSFSTPAPTLGVTQISPVDGMVLRYIPAGTFQMGSNDGDSNEQPVHSVTLDAFWMDQTEVTNAMYAQCVAAGGCSAPRDSGSYTRDSYYGNSTYANYPVIYVDWNQAEAYCAWAGRELPTEAQWEYAARGGLAGASYPWGNEFNGSLVNYCDANCASDWKDSAYNDGYADTAPVGSYPANGYGLYDMAGNVWEWAADWYGPYSSATVENPEGPASGDYRALRGGSWNVSEDYLRVSDRGWSAPDGAYSDLGFRCLLSP